MDIIKALEDFNYYHSVTDGSLEEWKAWRQQAVREWGLAMENRDSTAVLKGLYGYYVTDAHYSQEVQGLPHSKAEKQLVGLLRENMEEQARNTAESLLISTIADYEQQGFINGFRYATGIWKAC